MEPHITSSPHGLDKREKIGIGLAIPIAAILSVLIGIASWRRIQKRRTGTPIDEAATLAPDHTQPYLQQKAELEAEERRQYELHAQETRYEMAGEPAIQEISSDEGVRRLSRLQELRGEEHSKELEVPNNL